MLWCEHSYNHRMWQKWQNNLALQRWGDHGFVARGDELMNFRRVSLLQQEPEATPMNTDTHSLEGGGRGRGGRGKQVGRNNELKLSWVHFLPPVIYNWTKVSLTRTQILNGEAVGVDKYHLCAFFNTKLHLIPFLSVYSLVAEHTNLTSLFPSSSTSPSRTVWPAKDIKVLRHALSPTGVDICQCFRHPFK